VQIRHNPCDAHALCVGPWSFAVESLALTSFAPSSNIGMPGLGPRTALAHATGPAGPAPSSPPRSRPFSNADAGDRNMSWHFAIADADQSKSRCNAPRHAALAHRMTRVAVHGLPPFCSPSLPPRRRGQSLPPTAGIVRVGYRSIPLDMLPATLPASRGPMPVGWPAAMPMLSPAGSPQCRRLDRSRTGPPFALHASDARKTCSVWPRSDRGPRGRALGAKLTRARFEAAREVAPSMIGSSRRPPGE